jgi:hypothetical protein
MKLAQIQNWPRSVSALVVATCLLAGLFSVQAGQEERFETKDDAVKAFTAAAIKKDTNAMEVIFGPTIRELASPDAVQASNGLTHFAGRVSEKVVPVNKSDSCVEVDLGYDAWPFPVPLVKQDGKWFFDTEAGKEEILNRRVGRNELNTISVCRAYVEAQREYASECHNSEGVLEFAQHLRSTPGQHDGLYWHADEGGEVSPLGPLVAQAVGEGYTHDTKILAEKQTPYQGYFFKILTRQSQNAPGGKYSYIINGHMIGGFALVAWPAEWGNSGVMTFIINQQGKVFEKNLGPKTAAIASRMTTYDPGPGWKPALE